MKFLLFMLIGILLYPIFSFIVKRLTILFHFRLVFKNIYNKIVILTYKFKVYMLRKDYADKNNITYTTPFEFNYSDGKVTIETDSMSQIELLRELKTLEYEVESDINNMEDCLKNSEPMQHMINSFNSLKFAIKESNPYA